MENYEDLLLAYGRKKSYSEIGKSFLDGRREQVEAWLLEGKTERHVAALLGYSTVLGFRTAWRRVSGLTPRKWAAARGVKLPRYRSVARRARKPRSRFVLGFDLGEEPAREWDGCSPHPDADVI